MPLLLALPVAVGSFLAGVAFASSRRAPGHPSPLPGVALPAWERFVAVMCVAPRDHVSARKKLGTFQMGARRLTDIGLMTEYRKQQLGGGASAWVGSWRKPLTERKFLASMPLQYAAFVKSMRTAAPKVSGHVGELVEDGRCSLSGLLGVMHVAGEGGVESWVRNPLVRKRFPDTTETFRRTNGIF